MSGSNTAICPLGVPIASSSVLIASPSRKIPQKIRTVPKRRPSLSNRLAIVVWFVLVLLAGRAAQAIDHTDDTRPYWTGRIEQDTTWLDTVYVGGDVTIAAAATLTLAPNTQVLFLPYHDATQGGLDSTRAELIVEGRLAAQAGGIVFRSADAGSLGADWYGLVVERGGQADLSNATIRDGLRCVYSQARGRVTMDAIAFANCGKPTDPADAAGLSISRGSAQPLPARRVIQSVDPVDSLAESRGNMSTGKRVALKLIASTLGGVIGATMVAANLPCFPDDYAGDKGPFCKSLEAASLYGYPVGIAIGVSLVGPRDRPITSLIRPLVLSLGGSAVGLIGGILLANVNDDVFWPSLPVFPIVGATLASELWRKPPQDSQNSRVSVNLGPALNGGLSAVATLRF